MKSLEILTRAAILCLALLVQTSSAFAGGTEEGLTSGASAEAQERIAELIQNVLGPYRMEGTRTNGTNVTPSVTYTNIEANFRQASMLMPSRLDLRFGIASALVGQAIQTNSPFDLRMRSALKVYKDIRALDTNGFQAPLQYAAYTRAIGETNASESTIAQLMESHPQRTRAYLEKFRRVDEILQMAPSTNAQKAMPMSREHAIVVLGAALGTNGLMKVKLVDRLQQGLVLARLYPEAPIVVTGGNPTTGITEAYAMSLWFVNQGISTNRLHIEDRAGDTLGNAIRTCAILQKLGVTAVTLVTSASHIRRALASFEEASLQRGLRLSFSHLASIDEPDTDRDRERISVYRDMLRASGIWAFPGIQR